MRRRWLVVVGWAGDWKVHARRWTRWGAERKAHRVARRGPFPHLPVDVSHLTQGVGYCHEDEYDDLPDLPAMNDHG